MASDLNVYENPLIPDIARKDLREINTLEGFAWASHQLALQPPPLPRRAGDAPD